MRGMAGNPGNIDPIPLHASQYPVSSPKGEEKKPGTFSYESTEFLGMHFNKEETKQLWTVIMQNVSREIERQKSKTLKALKKLRPGHENDP